MNKIFNKLILIFSFCAVLAAFGAVALMIHNAQDPEHQLIKLLIDEDKKVSQVFFSPDHDLKSILIKLINSEKKRILVAIYTFTQKEIAQSLLHAYNRGIEIQIVSDPGYGTDRYSKIPNLANQGIPIWVYQSNKDRDSSLMHNKFCLFEDNILQKSILWTGSYNFTARAGNKNQENVLVLEDKKLIDQYANQFEILKSRSLLINGYQANSERSKKIAFAKLKG